MSNVISTVADLTAYFRSLAQRHPNIKKFVVGDSERILSLDRSKLDYPVLWFETPRTSWILATPAKAQLSGAFVVLINTRIDDNAREQYILDYAWQITRDLIAMIVEDAHLDYIDASQNSFNSDPILGYGTDNDYGWRTTYTIGAPIGNCPRMCQQLITQSSVFAARFKWQNTVAGDFSGLVITTENPANVTYDQLVYTVYVDNQAGESFTDELPVGLTAGNHILVKLVATVNGQETVASAVFSSDVGCGQSVPFLLSKKHFV